MKPSKDYHYFGGDRPSSIVATRQNDERANPFDSPRVYAISNDPKNKNLWVGRSRPVQPTRLTEIISSEE